jgi:hypothetical protein
MAKVDSKQRRRRRRLDVDAEPPAISLQGLGSTTGNDMRWRRVSMLRGRAVAGAHASDGSDRRK